MASNPFVPVPGQSGEFKQMNSLFEFRSGRTIAHTLDPRCKFILICMLGAGLVSAPAGPCIVLLLSTLLFLGNIGIKPVALAAELKFFILFLFFIVLVRALATPGAPLFSILGYPMSIQGFSQGGLVALRFFTVMVLGMAFCVTTRPSELKAAAQWLLKPIPFVPEKRAGIIISLSLRFLPMILSQAHESSLAMDARCGSGAKNAIKRISRLPLALLSKSFKKADRLGTAMDARCYTENRTDPGFAPSGREPVALLLAAAFLVFNFLHRI